MKHREIHKNIYWIGVNDRETYLFESLWPLPQGVAYNSYAITDKKVAIIDTVKGSYDSQFIEKLKELLNGRKPDYLIINHMEPDHSGSIKILIEIYPNITIVGNQKTIEFLNGFYGEFKNTLVVKEKDVLNLGEYELEFYLTPMVHWPETMMTYEKKTKTLFSGDAFGGFGTLDGGIFDDEVNTEFYEYETLRYYSNIVGKYAVMVNAAVSRLKDIEIKTICATHGPIYRKNPEKIINDYINWSNYKTERGVVIVYGSMYGNTKKMAEAISEGVKEAGIKDVIVHDISKSNLSYIIADIWKYNGVILGSCAYNQKIFPPMEHLLSFYENAKPKNHILGIFGSYSWSGGAVSRLKEFAKNIGWQVIEPEIEVKHAPKQQDLENCFKLGKELGARL